MRLSFSHHQGSAARSTRRRHVFVPTPHRNRLNKVQSAAKASAELPTHNPQGYLLWERRRLRPLLRALRNGHSKRSSSAFGWTGQRRFRCLEFTWNPCTNHGRHERVPENPRRESPAGGISSTARTLSLRVASTTEKVQGDEYFNVEKILEWRQGEVGLEYWVKWAGYGMKDNSWEPATHFEQCLEILEQFHQEKGLPLSAKFNRDSGASIVLEMAYSHPRALRAELFIDVVERLQLRGIVKFESLLLLPPRESMESQPGSAAVAEPHRRSYYVIAGCRSRE